MSDKKVYNSFEVKAMNDNIFKEITFEESISVENATLTFLGYESRNYKSASKRLPQSYHTHFYAELFFCKKGEMLLEYNGTSTTLHEGDAVFVPPQFPHFKSSESENVDFVVGITLKKKSCNSNFDMHKLLDKLFLAKKPVFFRRYTHILPEDMSWIEDIGSYSPLTALSAFHTLAKLAQIYSKSTPDCDCPNSQNRKTNLIIQIESYIGSKYYENITSESLAAMLYVSPRQLSRIVNEKYGEPLHRIIIKKRVETAAKLLCESNLSVEEISSTVGFDTKSCFYRTFKNKYGLTPLQFRKKAKKITNPTE